VERALVRSRVAEPMVGTRTIMLGPRGVNRELRQYGRDGDHK
jgi:hypothetical protein